MHQLLDEKMLMVHINLSFKSTLMPNKIKFIVYVAPDGNTMGLSNWAVLKTQHL